jgi:hypothetical protein
MRRPCGPPEHSRRTSAGSGIPRGHFAARGSRRSLPSRPATILSNMEPTSLDRAASGRGAGILRFFRSNGDTRSRRRGTRFSDFPRIIHALRPGTISTEDPARGRASRKPTSDVLEWNPEIRRERRRIPRAEGMGTFSVGCPVDPAITRGLSVRHAALRVWFSNAMLFKAKWSQHPFGYSTKPAFPT